MALSMKQKINTKSSTKAKVVGVDDTMNFFVWVKLFLEWQMKDHNKEEQTKLLGKHNVLLQDNMSTIQLERFGKRSSTKLNRHIFIRYFYCKYILDKKVTNAVTYCPTKELVSDFISKPLIGSLFRTHRNLIMGVTEANISLHQQEYQKAKQG